MRNVEQCLGEIIGRQYYDLHCIFNIVIYNGLKRLISTSTEQPTKTDRKTDLLLIFNAKKGEDRRQESRLKGWEYGGPKVLCDLQGASYKFHTSGGKAAADIVRFRGWNFHSACA